MIEEILYSYISAPELGVLSGRIAEISVKEKLDIEFFVKMIEILTKDINELNNSLTRENSNEYSALVKQKSEQRSYAFIVLRDTIKTALKRRSTAAREAAQLLVDTIKKMGWMINKQTESEKSHAIPLLLDELNKSAQLRAVELLGIRECLDDLKETQAEYEAAYNNKLETEGKKEDGLLLKDAKDILSRHLKNFLGAVEMLDESYPGVYENYISVINESISDIMFSVRSRKTRDRNDEKELSQAAMSTDTNIPVNNPINHL